MKRSVILATVVAVLSGSVPAAAQVFYQYPTAATVDKGDVNFGPLLAYGKDDLFRFAGFGRFGTGEYVDVGIELFADVRHSDWRGGAGFDVKLGLFPKTRALPFDVSVCAGIGVIGGKGRPTIQLPVGGILSSAFQLEGDKLLTPYIGAYAVVLRVEKLGEVETEVEAELRGGLSYTLTPNAELFATVHLGLDETIFIGAKFARPLAGLKP